MSEIAKCKCGSTSGREVRDDVSFRRYCHDALVCGMTGPWCPSWEASDAAWNDLMGTPSVTWTTGAAEEAADGTFVHVTDHRGYPFSTSWLIGRFGPLAETIGEGPCEVAITVKRVEPDQPEEPAEARLGEPPEVRDPHGLRALYERVKILENSLANLFEIVKARQSPPIVDCHEPKTDSPDAESDCPDECGMVPFHRSDGSRLFSHPIEHDFRPLYVTLADGVWRWNEAKSVYQEVPSYPRVYPDQPLWSESTGD